MNNYLPIKYKIQEACERICVRYLNRERNTWLQRLIFRAASAIDFRLRKLPRASRGFGFHFNEYIAPNGFKEMEP